MNRGLVVKTKGGSAGLLISALMFLASTGCGKVPTWGELTGQQPPATPTKPVAVQPAPPPAPSTPVAPPKPNAVEVIAKFKAIRPHLMTDGDLASVAALTEGLEEVTEVLATSSTISDSGLSHLAKLPNVKTLALDSTKVTDKGMEAVALATSLETINISQTGISDAGIASLATLPNLKTLNLVRCPLSPDGFAAIGRMPALEEIVLTGTPGVNDQTFDLMCNAQTLKRLRMDYVGGITDKGMHSLAKLEILEELSISECPVSGEALGHVAKTGLKNLRKLDMNKCPITLAGAKAINSCKSLEHLNVGYMNMDDKGFVILIQGLKNLKRLNVSYCKNVSGTGLTALKAADDLEVLTLTDTGVTNQSLELLKGHKNLQTLNLTNTRVTKAGIDALQKFLPDCKIVN